MPRLPFLLSGSCTEFPRENSSLRYFCTILPTTNSRFLALTPPFIPRPLPLTAQDALCIYRRYLYFITARKREKKKQAERNKRKCWNCGLHPLAGLLIEGIGDGIISTSLDFSRVPCHVDFARPPLHVAQIVQIIETVLFHNAACARCLLLPCDNDGCHR